MLRAKELMQQSADRSSILLVLLVIYISFQRKIHVGEMVMDFCRNARLTTGPVGGNVEGVHNAHGLS
jgi:hypothetical protein